jgi:diguanylate cyclase
VIRRLQRALTRDLFFVDERHLLITFSAGVTQVAAAETLDQAIARADAALYEAKRAGKNRVFVRLP